VRRRSSLAIAVLLITLLTAGACSRVPTESSTDQRESRRRLELERRCRQQRDALPALQAAVQRLDQELVRVESEVYVPAPAPAPLDPEEQRRLALYDQEVEQEQYDRARALWQEREVQREALWQRRHRVRLNTARQAQSTAMAALQGQRASLQRLMCGPRPPR
jgi:hypothetical protein